MEPYTLHENNNLISTKINKDISVIVENLKNAYGSNIKALFLVGGFGRGEGSVLIEKNYIQPINDYDIVMIIGEKCNLSQIPQIRKNLACQLGIWWVDIKVFTISKLPRLRYSMFTYDFKYGGRAIYGDSSYLSRIPEMDPTKMPLVEAEILFFTRIWCLLGPFSMNYWDIPPNKQESFFMANQLSKALLACSDGLLILRGLYHHSYSERFSVFESLSENDSHILPLIKEATEFKLYPKYDIDYHIMERWLEVRKIYLDTMWTFVNQMYKYEFENWQDYAWRYRNNPRQVIYYLGTLLLKRSTRHRKRISINLAQLFLLAANEHNLIKSELFTRAKLELKKATGSDTSKLSWEKARNIATEARMKI